MFDGILGNLFWSLSMLFHMIIPVLLIILAVSVGVGVWNRTRRKEDNDSRGPILILKERYARGEISEDEFFKKKEELSKV